MLSVNVFADDCDTPPDNLNATIDAVAGEVTLTWAGSDTGWFYCQVRITDPISGNTKRIRRPYPGGVVIDYVNRLAPSQTYDFNVQCACDFGPPVVATPISALSSFTTPAFRVGQVDATSGIYPNPAANMLMVDYSADKAEDVQITVMDLTGRTMSIASQSMTEGLNRVELDLSELADGQYVLQMQSTSGQTTDRFVVQH